MNTFKRMRPALGTYVEIGIVGTPSAIIDVAFTRAFDRIALIQQLLSFHHPDSDLSRLNCAYGKPVVCHPLSIRCLNLAKTMTHMSKGAFNCTLGASVVKQGALPAPLTNEEPLAVGNASDLQLQGLTAQLRRPLWITLDGIAKGFAIDSAILQMKMAGIQCGWINAGGDIRAFGNITLPISIRDHLDRNHVLGGIRNAAIATSTTVFSKDQPGLVLNTTGEPSQPASWSVLAHYAWRADALTKVAANTPPSVRAITVAKLGGTWQALPLQ